MMQLETNRLLIRPFVMADLEAVHQVLDHDLLWAGPGITVEQRRERLQREINLAQWADTNNLFGYRHLWLFTSPAFSRRTKALLATAI
jgi:hypothetical protein